MFFILEVNFLNQRYQDLIISNGTLYNRKEYYLSPLKLSCQKYKYVSPKVKTSLNLCVCVSAHTHIIKIICNFIFGYSCNAVGSDNK